MNFKVFMNLEIDLNYLLIKIHKLYITCPNAKKQSPCTLSLIELSIRANYEKLCFVVFKLCFVVFGQLV